MSKAPVGKAGAKSVLKWWFLMTTYVCHCGLIVDEELAKKIVKANDTADSELSWLDALEAILDSKNAGLVEHLEEYARAGANEDYDIVDGYGYFNGKSAADSDIYGVEAIILEPYNDAKLFEAAYASPEELVEEYRQRVEKLGISLTTDEIKDRVHNLNLEDWSN